MSPMSLRLEIGLKWAPVFPDCHQKSMSLYGGVPRSKFSSGHLTHGCGLLLPTRERAGSINALACALS